MLIEPQRAQSTGGVAVSAPAAQTSQPRTKKTPSSGVPQTPMCDADGPVFRQVSSVVESRHESSMMTAVDYVPAIHSLNVGEARALLVRLKEQFELIFRTFDVGKKHNRSIPSEANGSNDFDVFNLSRNPSAQPFLQKLNKAIHMNDTDLMAWLKTEEPSQLRLAYEQLLEKFKTLRNVTPRASSTQPGSSLSPQEHRTVRQAETDLFKLQNLFQQAFPERTFPKLTPPSVQTPAPTAVSTNIEKNAAAPQSVTPSLSEAIKTRESGLRAWANQAGQAVWSFGKSLSEAVTGSLKKPSPDMLRRATRVKGRLE